MADNFIGGLFAFLCLAVFAALVIGTIVVLQKLIRKAERFDRDRAVRRNLRDQVRDEQVIKSEAQRILRENGQDE